MFWNTFLPRKASEICKQQIQPSLPTCIHKPKRNSSPNLLILLESSTHQWRVTRVEKKFQDKAQKNLNQTWDSPPSSLLSYLLLNFGSPLLSSFSSYCCIIRAPGCDPSPPSNRSSLLSLYFSYFSSYPTVSPQCAEGVGLKAKQSFGTLQLKLFIVFITMHKRIGITEEKNEVCI